jgi:hypothetical protein
MTDAELIAGLEDCSLPESAFRHVNHVRAAYIYLRGSSFANAIDRMSRAIRGYGASHGKTHLYHETITVAFVALINERIHARGDGGNWDGFASANPDLLDKRILSHYYRRETLQSPIARVAFVVGEFSPTPYDYDEHVFRSAEPAARARSGQIESS